MNNPLSHSDTVIERFRESQDIVDPEAVQALYIPKLESFIQEVEQSATLEAKLRGRQIFIDEVDWDEWGVSDEEAGEKFDQCWEESIINKK